MPIFYPGYGFGGPFIGGFLGSFLGSQIRPYPPYRPSPYYRRPFYPPYYRPF